MNSDDDIGDCIESDDEIGFQPSSKGPGTAAFALDDELGGAQIAPVSLSVPSGPSGAGTTAVTGKSAKSHSTASSILNAPAAGLGGLLNLVSGGASRKKSESGTTSTNLTAGPGPGPSG